jgi:hypothetical protein
VRRGPQGQKRPADVIGNAVKVMRIATGEETEELDSVKSAAAELGSRGGMARAAKMSAKRRKDIARRAAEIRWAECRAFCGSSASAKRCSSGSIPHCAKLPGPILGAKCRVDCLRQPC